MDENLRAQINTYLAQLDALIRRGSKLRDTLAADPSDNSALVANRAWHQDCGAIIHQLSGGSKAHWLARAFSEAFLVQSSSGGVIEAVAPADIAQRLIGVLEQAVRSLSQMGDGSGASAAPGAAPPPRRFEFVHNRELRPVIERAFSDSRDALEQGSYGVALITCCGILETIVTDALEYRGIDGLADARAPVGKIADWPFEMRLEVAQEVGLIRGGWVRLPDVARKYRDLADADPPPAIFERDARRAMQVLHVVMKDLDPGR